MQQVAIDAGTRSLRAWPGGTSEMGALIRAHDWQETPLGALEVWPQSLKTMVDFILGSAFPTLLLWGESLTQIYNDSFCPLIGNRHRTLAQPLAENWPELMRDFESTLDRVWRGETVTVEKVKRPILKDGIIVRAWFTAHCSPARDESGRVAGICITLVETTKLVLAEVANQENEDRLKRLLDFLPVGVGFFDGQGEFQFENSVLARLRKNADRYADGTDRVRLYDQEGRQLEPHEYPRSRALRGEVVHPQRDLFAVLEGKRSWVRVGAAPFLQEGEVMGGVLIALDATEAKANADHLQVLVAELQHRTRNLIAVVRSLAERTIAGSDSLSGFAVKFGARLAALARVQGLLSRLTEGEKITFDALLRAELSAHAALDDEHARVTLDGPSGVKLRFSTIQTLALALHELATNADKYGALAQPGGRLDVRWRVEAAEDGQGRNLHVDWRESGVTIGGDHAAACGGGYGRELIEHVLPYQLKARTKFELTPDGVHCALMLAIANDPPGHDGVRIGRQGPADGGPAGPRFPPLNRCPRSSC
jgi:two-component sensor histidine kinase